MLTRAVPLPALAVPLPAIAAKLTHRLPRPRRPELVATEELLRRRDALPAGDPARAVLRAQAIEQNLPLANSLARRYAGRGELHEDLAQAAAIALIKAVDGFDPTRLVPFAGYAMPSIIGSLKRHFRDSAWAMRVPRSVQDLTREVATASEEIGQRLGRPATTTELAEQLQVPRTNVGIAIGARNAYRLASLNALVPGGGELGDSVGEVDPRYAIVDIHLTLAPLLSALPARERRILTLRYRDELSQARIAAEIGVSQMQVSRLLRQTLDRMRADLPD